MKLKKDYQICLFIVGCILINYIGRLLADGFVLPVWLDSVGTVFAAYVFGPVCGAIVGATMNILYCLQLPTALFYGLTNAAVGVAVGICTRRGYLKNIFGMLSTAFLVAVLSTLISTPLNFFLSDGSTGNMWGDGVSDLLQEMGINKIISYIIGEFYLDFLDKLIIMLLLFSAVQIVRRNRQRSREKKKREKRVSEIILIFLLFQAVCLPTGTVQAREPETGRKTIDYDFRRYVQTVYNGENGLPGGMADDIVQTKDGVLWIGTHGGLYRYSGNGFQWMNQLESVKNVNCLYTDEAGRLWIGTNDNGLSICIDQKISNVVNRENGLPSHSVYCITENTDGYYFVGTAGSLVVMTLSSGLKVCDTISEIVHAICICADRDDNVAAVTEEGKLYLVCGTEAAAQRTAGPGKAVYTCCTFDNKGRLYAGTSGNTVEIYQVSNGQLTLEYSITCSGLEGINSLYFSEEGILFACADNGAGYINTEGKFFPVGMNRFNGSIGHMLIDYQGNLWFTSSRYGVLRLCPSPFMEVYRMDETSEDVVRTTAKWQDCLYFGTDNGLDTVDEENAGKTADEVKQALQGTSVSCLMVDSRSHMWAATADRGVWEISENGDVNVYDSKAGALGDGFCSVIETKDGAIVAAGDFGVTFIKDGAVYDTIGAADGLRDSAVLSLCEREDGSLLVGTDGNGIALIEDGKVTGFFTQEDGLSSEVVLRIVPDSDGGFFVVTGNGLCYIEDKTAVRMLEQFPYYNNYDLVEGNQGELFVLSSAGIYIVDKAELLSGVEVTYELLDTKKGLQVNLTPNAWNYTDGKSTLYLSGDTGIVSIDLNQYDIAARSYRMLLTKIGVDGKTYPIEKGEKISIPREAERIEVNPEVVNYSINDPDISVWLEGFEKEPKIMPQSGFTGVVYTNLPGGEYTFHLAVLNSRTGSVITESTYRFTKEKEIYDNWWFRLYVATVAAIMVSYLTWLFFRTQIQKTMRIQKMELEWAKNQLQMGNETIVTIAQAVDAKDERTSEHSLRVSEYSVLIAKKLDYSDEACENIRKIALLHDIGKIGIPDQVLNKPSRLTDEEYEIMKSHVTRGAEILKNFTLIDHVADGALYHHERYDGKGYANGLKGEEIPLNARIIGIADAFDAMTANRVYRKKLDLAYVLEELRKGSGTQFDPRLVEIMLGLIEDGTIDVDQIYKSKDGVDDENEG